MSIRSIGEYRRRRPIQKTDAPHPDSEPIGTFNSVGSRDSNARERNGEPVYAMNDISNGSAGAEVIEIMFLDGTWILCDLEELVPFGETGH